MRLVSEAWDGFIEISSTSTNQIVDNKALPSSGALISSTLSNQFISDFALLSFSHHFLIATKLNAIEERAFYIQNAVNSFWSVTTLENHINNNLFYAKGKIQNNFAKTITNEGNRDQALQVFKDEYLLDFINIEDPDLVDERELEDAIVRNIRKFILSIGSDFAFIGNQYRLLVDEEEFFIDLLFFNRKLQCLVAFELKKGSLSLSISAK